MTFADGTTAFANVLIGADGVNSTVRKQILATHIRALSPNDDQDRIEQLKRCAERE